MANPCVAHGGSQARAGFGIAVDVSAAGLAARFANTAGWFSAVIAGVIAGAHYELSTFCGNDPPTEPTLTAQDFVDALSVSDFANKVIAEKKILDWVGSHIWYDLCQCADLTNPTPGTYQSDPGNMPQVDPPTVVPPAQSTPCASSSFLTSVTSNSPIICAGPITLPFGVQGFTFQGWQDRTGTLKTSQVGITALFKDASNATVVSSLMSIAPIRDVNNKAVMSIAVPANAVTLTFFAQSGDTSNTEKTAVTWQTWCGNQPGPITGCCPPDPLMVAQMAQILDLVTLIQRQSVPFGYVAGGVHTTLSGAGAISIAGILGVKVAVTTLPASYGVAGTSPPEHFDLGFVTFGTADGFPSAFRLTRNPQVMMPARCSVYTDLDYDLAPGVVVTITELLREP